MFALLTKKAKRLWIRTQCSQSMPSLCWNFSWLKIAGNTLYFREREEARKAGEPEPWLRLVAFPCGLLQSWRLNIMSNRIVISQNKATVHLKDAAGPGDPARQAVCTLSQTSVRFNSGNCWKQATTLVRLFYLPCRQCGLGSFRLPFLLLLSSARRVVFPTWLLGRFSC